MTAGAEALAAEEFLYTTLTSDATLTAMLPGGATAGIFNAQAREGATYPLVVYQFMSGIDMAAVGALRIWTDMVWLVKAIGDSTNLFAVSAAAARIDVLLHRTSGVATDGTVWAAVREQVIQMPEIVAGRTYRHQGGLYRVYAS